MKEENGKNKKKSVWYILGGVAVASGMCAIMPKFIKAGSDYLYKKSQPAAKCNEDYWGPEIVKKDALGDKNGKI